jgi:hypothetical protein
MVRVRTELDHPIPREIIDDALKALSMQPHVSSQPRHGLSRRRKRNGAENLPPGAGQTKACDQIVAGRDEAAIEAENLKDERCDSRAGGDESRVSHGATRIILTTRCQSH